MIRNWGSAMLEFGRTLLRWRTRHCSRRVSTWTPLATAFNAPPARRINFTHDDVVRPKVCKTQDLWLGIHGLFPVGPLWHARTAEFWGLLSPSRQCGKPDAGADLGGHLRSTTSKDGRHFWRAFWLIVQGGGPRRVCSYRASSEQVHPSSRAGLHKHLRNGREP